MWPRYQGNFIRKPPATDPHDEAVPAREAMAGRWGLIPWRLEPVTEKIKAAVARSTFTARIEGIEKITPLAPPGHAGKSASCRQTLFMNLTGVAEKL